MIQDNLYDNKYCRYGRQYGFDRSRLQKEPDVEGYVQSRHRAPPTIISEVYEEVMV